MNICLLIFTIIFFGLLGGLVNAIRTEQEDKIYWKSLVKGLVAAFLVPVFLEIIKSQLGQNLSTNLYDYIVFRFTIWTIFRYHKISRILSNIIGSYNRILVGKYIVF